MNKPIINTKDRRCSNCKRVKARGGEMYCKYATNVGPYDWCNAWVEGRSRDYIAHGISIADGIRQCAAQ